MIVSGRKTTSWDEMAVVVICSFLILDRYVPEVKLSRTKLGAGFIFAR
jgi:hypothetical protein